MKNFNDGKTTSCKFTCNLAGPVTNAMIENFQFL